MSVAVTNSTGYILASDGNSVNYIKKQLVTVAAVGNNVVINWYINHKIIYPYTDFTAPSGASATAVANAIAAFLNT